MATSHNPPDYLLGPLMSVELAVLSVFKAHPQLQDKEIETIYEQFKDFYQNLAKGKEVYEPDSGNAIRLAVISAILVALDMRVETGADDHLIQNDEVHPGGRPIPNVEALYASGFNYLIHSTRFWRKENGPKGYLKFISETMNF
ncbi:MAG: hypothetical protein IPJ40_14360 [Saprospirales bacterium]|nr:hypothetical protein [Saprospirales bacterium]